MPKTKPHQYVQNKQVDFDWNELKSSWPAPLVLRSDVKKFSGVLHPRTMANLDSQGLGPEKIIVGKKVAYPRDALISWLQARLQYEK